MKRIITATLISALLVAVLAIPVYAEVIPSPPEGVTQTDPIILVKTITNVVLVIVGLVAVLFLIIGGFRYITSAGNPDAMQAAKTTVLYAIIGLAIAVLSWTILNYIYRLLTR